MNHQEILDVSINTIIKSFVNFAKIKKERKFQILDLIIPQERKVRSIVGGLETSLGTTLWEPLIKALAEENNFLIHSEELQCPVHMPTTLSNTLSTILIDRENKGGIYDAKKSHAEIKAICQTFIQNPIEQFHSPPSGFGVDIWLEKDGINYVFDSKTVQPNLAGFTRFLRQVLNWYAYFYSKFPQGEIQARIFFPYNPSKHRGQSFWEGATGHGKPLEPDTEGWVENQLWDFCSGYIGTYRVIEEAFTLIKDKGLVTKELEKIFK